MNSLLKILSVFMLLFLSMSIAAGCGETAQFSVSEVISNPAYYYEWQNYHTATGGDDFKGGLVVYTGQQDSTSIAVIVPEGFKAGNVSELEDNPVLAVSLKKSDYNKLTIGNTVDVNGRIRKAGDLYYIDTVGADFKGVTVTGLVSASDPDFEGVLALIREKEMADDIDDAIISFYANPGNPASPFYPR